MGGGERGVGLGVGSQRREGRGECEGEEGEKGGGERLAWARCRFEFYLLLIRVSCPLSVSRYVPFSFLSSAISYKLVLGFPCISVRFAYMPLICVKFCHGLVCITMPLVCVNSVTTWFA